MIQCPDCDAQQPHGSIYCNECGALLLNLAQDSQEKQEQIPFEIPARTASEPALVGQDLNPVLEADHIIFFIPSSGRRTKIELDKEVFIGRSDQRSDWHPALDLTADSGSEYGVSRQHALIRLSDEGVVLIDKGSTNGTFLNGYRLPQDLPYPIHSGDEIRFGLLLTHVFLE